MATQRLSPKARQARQEKQKTLNISVDEKTRIYDFYVREDIESLNGISKEDFISDMNASFVYNLIQCYYDYIKFIENIENNTLLKYFSFDSSFISFNRNRNLLKKIDAYNIREYNDDFKNFLSLCGYDHNVSFSINEADSIIDLFVLYLNYLSLKKEKDFDLFASNFSPKITFEFYKENKDFIMDSYLKFKSTYFKIKEAINFSKEFNINCSCSDITDLISKYYAGDHEAVRFVMCSECARYDSSTNKKEVYEKYCTEYDNEYSFARDLGIEVSFYEYGTMSDGKKIEIISDAYSKNSSKYKLESGMELLESVLSGISDINSDNVSKKGGFLNFRKKSKESKDGRIYDYLIENNLITKSVISKEDFLSPEKSRLVDYNKNKKAAIIDCYRVAMYVSNNIDIQKRFSNEPFFVLNQSNFSLNNCFSYFWKLADNYNIKENINLATYLLFPPIIKKGIKEVNTNNSKSFMTGYALGVINNTLEENHQNRGRR